MDPKRLLDQFLGPNATGRAGDMMTKAKDALGKSGMGGAAGGLAAGGMLGLLLGSKKVRKMAGGVVGYGGAAALGALAYRAYENWQAGKKASEAPAAIPSDAPPVGSKFLPNGNQDAGGRPFELSLVLAMIGAANADGHIGPDEQRAIFDQAGKMGLDAEDKAFVFDALGKPPTLDDIARMAKGPEQAAELWLAARLAIDPDEVSEKAYLEALAHKLNLPNDLTAHLERQIQVA